MSEIILTKQASVSTPSAGKMSLYIGTDGELYQKDEAGVASIIGGDIGALLISQRGAPNGVASLDAVGLMPTNEMATGTPDITKYLRGDRVWATPAGGNGGGIGAVECYDSTGARDDVPVLAIVDIDTLTVSSELIIGASCDISQNTSGNYGWADLMQQLTVKGSGTSSPSWGATIGNYEGLVWSASVMNQAFVDFHIDHDIALNTLLYPHVHFRPLNSSAGVVRWGFEYSVSKGHGQTTGFPTSTTVYVDFTVGINNLGTHYVAEVSQANAIPALNIEPDSVVHIRVFRDAANVADTYPGTVWAWQSDIHYQMGRLSTLNKAPNFFA